MDSGGSTDMTLAFDLEALRRLAYPDRVFPFPIAESFIVVNDTHCAS